MKHCMCLGKYYIICTQFSKDPQTVSPTSISLNKLRSPVLVQEFSKPRRAEVIFHIICSASMNCSLCNSSITFWCLVGEKYETVPTQSNKLKMDITQRQKMHIHPSDSSALWSHYSVRQFP